MQWIGEAVARAGMTRRQLALRAGLSPSTVTRIDHGAIDPSLGTLKAVLGAAGLQIPERLEPLCDVDAVHAARYVLADEPVPEPLQGWERTLKRWVSPDGTPRPRALATQAGAAAPVHRRPGVTHLLTPWNALRVCSTVAATREGWAVSGSYAASYIGATERPGPVVIYAESPAHASAVIESAPEGHEVLLVPFDGRSEARLWSVDGMVLADPLQIILDCYGIPDAVPSADELTEGWA